MINMQTHDTTLVCSDCGQEFTFTAGEQTSYARRGQSKPSQCAFCRAAHMITDGVQNRSGGSTGEHTMYSAVCSRCGKQTKVPFEPRGYRPVYCSDCYQEQHKTSSGGYDGGRNRTGSRNRR